MQITHAMSARTRSAAAVIRLVNAPPAFRNPDRRRRPGSAPGPPAPALRRLGPVLRRPAPPRSRVVRAAPIHRSTVTSLRVTRQAVRRRVALRSSIAGVAFRADGCLPSDGRARSESVSGSHAMVGWALSIGLIDLPFSHWTRITFKHNW
jgi:hypothetical protein